MKTRRQVSALHRAWLNLMLIVLSLALVRGRGVAQQLTTLIPFTNVWKYDQSGNDLGMAVMSGMKLVAVSEMPLVITSQPPSQIVSVGDPVAFSVGVSGGPVSYRWQKDGVDLSATNSVLTIPGAEFTDSGDYRLICSNSLTVVTSSVAALTVVDDLTGPKPLLAIADDGYGPRSIRIQFSERMITFSVANRENWRVSRRGSSDFVTITNVLYNSALGALLRLDASDPNWVEYDDYVVTINGVVDSRGNVIAPNTRVPVAWRYPTNLITGSQSWDFHDSAIFDPGVYEEPWYAEDYAPGPWWGQGSGGFFGGPTLQYPCPSIAAPQVAISYQPEPTLFRTSFQWPAHWPNTGSLSLRFGVDDALVVYVNGTEYYRNNAAGPAGSAVTSQSRALSTIPNAFCITNIVLNTTNLHSGTNWIAVAAIQSDFDQQNSYFVFDMSGSVLLAPELPSEPLPVLQGSVAGPDELLFSWTGSGYALEASESLELGPLSYPDGPWFEVPQMTNPYVWNLTNGPQRYFRLKR